jgi:hypothetical protein
MKLLAITALSLSLAALSAAAPSTDPSAPPAEGQTRVKEIAPGQSHRWTILQRATRLDAFAVEAGRQRGLRIYLFNAEGKLVACDEDASDGLGFGVRDGWQGPFTLVVKNASREHNAYRLMVE